MGKSWRDHALSVIGEVMKSNPAARGNDLRKLLRDAYPFGMREYTPYRIWCEEVNRACIGTAHPKKAAEQDKDADLFKHGNEYL